MGQVLHGSARTTAALRRAIQHSQESLLKLSRRYGINPKTVRKWRRRSFVEDAPMGPKQPRSTVLSQEQEAVIVAFRKHTLLPLDDCLYALKATIPQLTRSALHRCLQRHGISRLPRLDSSGPIRKKFKSYPIGYFHIDLTEVRTEEGRLHLFVAVDRTSKLAFARLVEKATRRTAADFLQELITAVPYQIHTVLTDNGTHFTSPGDGRSAVPEIRLAMASGEVFRAHAFEYACARHGIDHRLIKPNHPWTNGQVERMNRTLKEATVRSYHYQSHAHLREHLATFLDAYNFAKHLKALNGLTSYQFICSRWQIEPLRFKSNPHHLSPGLNI
jgi:transposase InsO family protein